jgi:DNA-binding GntR family transcriptional regulator
MRVTPDLRDEIRRAIENITKRDRCRTVHSSHEHREFAAAVIAGEAERAATFGVEHLESGRSCNLSPRRFLNEA